ncbi:MAG: tetratricopeptide repeat protein [Candidatus Obscuribacterales bacterium]|nr:tetratricopeptide repeat protein [Candidatus Obscuribacterales bacterium]
MPFQKLVFLSLFAVSSYFLFDRTLVSAAVSDSSWDNYHAMAQAATRQRDWNKAQQFWRLSVQEADDTGADLTKLIPSLMGLGDALTQLGRVNDALAVYQRAYNVLLREKGPASSETINAMIDLASCYESQGLNRKAEDMYNRIFALESQSADPAVMAHGYHRAASYYARSGKLEKGASAYRKAISKLDKNAASVAQSAQLQSILKSYSDLLKEQNKTGEAQEIDKKLNNLASIQSQSSVDAGSGRIGSSVQESESSTFSSTAAQVNESTFGSQENESNKIISSAESVSANSMFATLSEVSAGQKRYDEAEPLYRKVIEIDEQSLGPDHPGLASDLTNLALLYNLQGKNSEALPLLERALSIYLKAYGDSNLAVVDCKLNLATTYDRLGQSQKAEELYKQALESSQSAGGPGKFVTAKILNRLAFFYYKQSRYSESEATYIKALAATEQSMGASSRYVAACCQDYARVLQAAGKTAEANAIRNRAKQILSIAGM